MNRTIVLSKTQDVVLLQGQHYFEERYRQREQHNLTKRAAKMGMRAVEAEVVALRMNIGSITEREFLERVAPVEFTNNQTRRNYATLSDSCLRVGNLRISLDLRQTAAIR